LLTRWLARRYTATVDVAFHQLNSEFLTADSNFQRRDLDKTGDEIPPDKCLSSFGEVFFTARRYASAVFAAIACPSVRWLVCPSEAGIVSKRKKRRITQTTPLDSSTNTSIN